MLKAIALAASAVAVAGCASEPPTVRDYYHRPATNPQQLATDRHACIVQAQQGVASGSYYKGSGGFTAETVVKRPVFESCMAAKGYKITTDGSAPNPIERHGNLPKILMVP